MIPRGAVFDIYVSFKFHHIVLCGDKNGAQSNLFCLVAIVWHYQQAQGAQADLVPTLAFLIQRPFWSYKMLQDFPSNLEML